MTYKKVINLHCANHADNYVSQQLWHLRIHLRIHFFLPCQITSNLIKAGWLGSVGHTCTRTDAHTHKLLTVFFWRIQEKLQAPCGHRRDGNWDRLLRHAKGRATRINRQIKKHGRSGWRPKQKRDKCTTGKQWWRIIQPKNRKKKIGFTRNKQLYRDSHSEPGQYPKTGMGSSLDWKTNITPCGLWIRSGLGISHWDEGTCGGEERRRQGKREEWTNAQKSPIQLEVKGDRTQFLRITQEN